MLRRRAKIRVKPVISSVSSSSAANEVEETAEKNVVASETPPESEKQQQQHNTEERIDSDRQQKIEIIANEDSILEIGSEGAPVESSIRFDESIVERLDQACNRLNSTVNNESSSNDKNSEKAPSFEDYISIPIIFSDRDDRPASSRAESPKSTSTRSEEVERTRTNKTSILSKTFERKRAAERLADKLVKKRVVEKDKKVKMVGILSEPVDSSQICMRDLIYLNPRDNPMSSSDANEGRTILKEAVVTEEPQPAEEMPVPQLEIGPDGKIIINEASLIIPQKSPNFNEMMVVDDTNYFFDGYKSKKPRSKKWGMKETKRFYAALSMIGTDFSLISKLLPNRTRDEIKNKFKSEDRKNRTLIDTALKVKKPLDISVLAEPPSDDDLIDEKPPKKKKAEKENKNQNKKPTNSQKKQQNQKEIGDKSTKKTSKAPSKKRKVASFESSDESSREAADEGGSKIPSRKRDETKRRKIIEDDDSPAATEETPLQNPADPYYFDEDTDVEYDVEITKFTQKRTARVFQRATESPDQPSPEALDSPSLQAKFSQQLEQMEIDRRISELKSIDEDDDPNLNPLDNPEEENIQEHCQKLFNQLPSTMKSRASINIIDHNSINLEELGIGEIPPNHKLVVVSTPLKEGMSEENDGSDQQLLQVFTISESALKSMMEDAKNSNFDPVEAFLTMAQGIDSSDKAQQDPPGSAEYSDDRRPDEDSHASSDIDASMLDGLISTTDDFPSMLSPPMVQNEIFLEDVKVFPYLDISEGLDDRPCPTEDTPTSAPDDGYSGAAS